MKSDRETHKDGVMWECLTIKLDLVTAEAPNGLIETTYLITVVSRGCRTFERRIESDDVFRSWRAGRPVVQQQLLGQSQVQETQAVYIIPWSGVG